MIDVDPFIKNAKKGTEWFGKAGMDVLYLGHRMLLNSLREGADDVAHGIGSLVTKTIGNQKAIELAKGQLDLMHDERGLPRVPGEALGEVRGQAESWIEAPTHVSER